MPIEGVNSGNKEDLLALQIELAEEAAKASATQQADKATDKYHDKLAEEDILMGEDTPYERSNAQRLASIVAEKGRV
ncbi:hypothetical protein [Endozoicomonas sp.]|uniref:hypothetical protein n=1 Tax=Endozoicomonas sp. TaxID=1892382 RepID=UPI003AF49A2E